MRWTRTRDVKRIADIVKQIDETPRPTQGDDYYVIRWNDGEGTCRTLNFWKGDGRADAIVALFDFDVHGYISEGTMCGEDETLRKTKIYLRRERAGEVL